MEFIPSSEMKCPKSGFLKLIIAWGESGKLERNSIIYNVNSFSLPTACYLVRLVEQFLCTVEKFCGQRLVSALRKIGPVCKT